MPSATSVHGHEVLHLLLDASAPFTRRTLAMEIGRRFGPEVRFHTCSIDGLTLDQLLAFLLSREKVVETPAGHLVAQPHKICNGDGHDHGDDH